MTICANDLNKLQALRWARKSNNPANKMIGMYTRLAILEWSNLKDIEILEFQNIGALEYWTIGIITRSLE